MNRGISRTLEDTGMSLGRQDRLRERDLGWIFRGDLFSSALMEHFLWLGLGIKGFVRSNKKMHTAGMVPSGSHGPSQCLHTFTVWTHLWPMALLPVTHRHTHTHTHTHSHTHTHTKDTPKGRLFAETLMFLPWESKVRQHSQNPRDLTWSRWPQSWKDSWNVRVCVLCVSERHVYVLCVCVCARCMCVCSMCVCLTTVTARFTFLEQVNVPEGLYRSRHSDVCKNLSERLSWQLSHGLSPWQQVCHMTHTHAYTDTQACTHTQASLQPFYKQCQ